MENNIVITLLQLKGINRKTILKSFDLSDDSECTLQHIKEQLLKASLKDSRIGCYSDEEIGIAFQKAHNIIEQSNKSNVKIVTFLDQKYPKRLKDITDPPVVLYYKGDIECLNASRVVAIIGTRKPTEYGLKIARNLGESFGKRKYTVVSGLAIGCDQFGHEGCLDVNGRTVAVMPCGLDTIYPAQNRGLAKRILDFGGCLLSEYPIGTKVFKNQLVERDRLQSGLSDGVIVVETAERGGTLHTVNYAIEYKRIVGCYNHPAKYLSQKQTAGNQMLIKGKKAIAIGTNEELCDFRKLMEKRPNQKEDGQEKIVQETIFDFIE